MIKKATKSDVVKLFALESKIFTKEDFQLSQSSFYYHVKNNIIYVKKEKNKPIGYLLVLPRKKYFRLYSLCVDPDFRGRGVAEELLNHLFKRHKGIYQLEVKQSNIAAIKLYKKMNFKIVKELKDFYPNENGFLFKRMG
jgi:ribosomal-protein-alanine N-acetyltransferase